MAGEEIERRLAAIMSADVVGYSRLMGKDDAGTLTALKALRKEFFAPKVAEHHGRIVKLMGDGALVEFRSVVDAVECAVAVQQGMADRNRDTPEDKRIDFRIGVNLGDIIIEGNDLYGDGVNVAARMQELAAPGGVTLSATAHEHAVTKVQVGFEDGGEQNLKNIAKPVRIYHWSDDADRQSDIADTESSLSLPDKPSIAVLPFVNMSGDPEQEYFSDGITEDIITELSRFSSLFVIARNSSFSYKGKSVKVQDIGRDLGVRYVVEGSVRKAGNRVRITAQLVETASGNHLWAERYDRDLDDIFAVQDEITQTISAAIEPELAGVEQDIARRKAPENLGAWDYHQRGLWHLYQFTVDGLSQAERLFGRAISIEPGLARAHAGLAYVYIQEAFYGDPTLRQTILEAALSSAKRAVACDDRDALCHFALGRAYSLRREPTEAIAELETAIDLNPSFAQAYFGLGFTLTNIGRQAEAISLLKKAASLSPYDSHLWTFLNMTALAHFRLGELEKAEEYIRKSVRQPNATYWPFATMTALLGASGKIEEAHTAADALLDKKPNYTCRFAREDFFFTEHDKFVDVYVEGLRKAGLPE